MSGRCLVKVCIAYPSSVPSAPSGRHACSVGAMLCAGARPSVERQMDLALRAIEVPIVIVCAIRGWFVYSVFSRTASQAIGIVLSVGRCATNAS